MTQPPAPDLDPTLDLAERQLALLGELADMAMATARAFAASAIASARAEEMILAEECFTPEVGRAKACGARDGAESFQKVSRAVRLTFMLQMNLAEIVRDIRAGHVTYLGGIAVRKDACAPSRAPRALADDRDSDRGRRGSSADHLVDVERPDVVARAPFRDTVEQICGDLGATVDWKTWRLQAPEPETDDGAEPPERSRPVPARPPG